MKFHAASASADGELQNVAQRAADGTALKVAVFGAGV
jgi:hypothetical protein